MTRKYAATKLFEHGELSFKEFKDITGWTTKQCYKTIENLRQDGAISFTYKDGSNQRCYFLD